MLSKESRHCPHGLYAQSLVSYWPEGQGGFGLVYTESKARLVLAVKALKRDNCVSLPEYNNLTIYFDLHVRIVGLTLLRLAQRRLLSGCIYAIPTACHYMVCILCLRMDNNFTDRVDIRRGLGLELPALDATACRHRDIKPVCFLSPPWTKFPLHFMLEG